MAFVGTPARHSRSWLHPLPQSSYLAPPPPQESIPRACPHILSYILYSPQSLIHKGQRDSWFSTWLQDTKKAGRAETEAQVIWLVFDYEEGCGQRGLCSSRPRRGKWFSVWTPNLFCPVWDKNSEKANSLYFTREIISAPAVDVRPSGSLFWTPWPTPIKTWILRSVLLDCFLILRP